MYAFTFSDGPSLSLHYDFAVNRVNVVLSISLHLYIGRTLSFCQVGIFTQTSNEINHRSLRNIVVLGGILISNVERP